MAISQADYDNGSIVHRPVSISDSTISCRIVPLNIVNFNHVSFKTLIESLFVRVSSGLCIATQDKKCNVHIDDSCQRDLLKDPINNDITTVYDNTDCLSGVLGNTGLSNNVLLSWHSPRHHWPQDTMLQRPVTRVLIEFKSHALVVYCLYTSLREESILVPSLDDNLK